ncbi:MAG: hypothetical protein J5517_05250 [Eubacterium sp.]|nr:hypothetical protein [Eubacterium sp.]
MSETWGAGIFQNASGEDIKNYYMAMLKRGASDDEAYDASLKVLKNFTDEESRSNAIIGLAYTMWKYGRINDNVRDLLNEALGYENRRVWNSKNKEKQRSKNIVKLQNDLSVDVERKKVPIYKPFITDWKAGDVYYFKLNEDGVYVPDDFKGYYVIMLIVSVYQKDWDVRYINSDISQVRFYMLNHKPLNVEEIHDSVPICFRKPLIDPIGINHSVVFSGYFCERSKNKRPKDLTFLGRYDENDRIKQLYQNNALILFWGDLLEKELIQGFGNTIDLIKEHKNKTDGLK